MDKKLRRLMNGHTVQFKHSDLQNLPHEIFNDYNSNLIMKNHMRGKGVRLQLSGDEAQTLGGKLSFGKIGKKIKNTAKSVGDDIKDAGMDAKRYLGDTENRKYGKKVMGVVNWQNKNLQKIANSSVVQNSPFGNTISALANANDQGVEFLNDFHKARKEKGGLGKDLMNATKANVKRKVNTAVRSAVGTAQNQVNSAVANATNEASNAFNNYWGSGLKSDVKNALLSAYTQEKGKLKQRARNEILNGIDYMQNDGKDLLESRVKNSRQYQMAKNRINRELSKSEGGSFRPNGGSFRGNLSGGSFRGNFSGGSFRGNGIVFNGGALKVYDDNSPFLRQDQPGFWPVKPKSIRETKGV